MTSVFRRMPLRSIPRRATQPGIATSTALIANGGLRIATDPFRILMFALTILNVSRVHQHYSVLMKLRPALLLVAAATVYAYLNPRVLTRENVLGYWPMRLLVVLGVLACYSAVFGISLGRSATFILGVYSKTLIYAFLLAVCIRHVRDLFTLVWAYVLSCSILAFFSLFVFGIHKTGSNDFARLSNLYTYDANDLCVVMLVGLPLVLLLLPLSRGRRRWFLLLTLVGIAATVARSGSRGGFLGFVALGLAALVLPTGMSVRKRVILLTAAPLALALGAPMGYWKQMSTVLQPKEDYNYSAIDGRKAVALRGIGYMWKYPVFGLGMNNFPRAECTISPKLATLNRSGPIRCTPPHNSYVEAGAELGFPGLIVWVSLEIGIIVALMRLRRRLPRAWLRGNESERFIYGATSFFPLAMVGFAVTAFFVSFAWMEILYIMAAFTTGLYIAVAAHLRHGNGVLPVIVASTSRRTRRGALGRRLAHAARTSRISRSSLSHPESVPCIPL